MRKSIFLKNLVFFLLPLLIPIIILGSLSILITQNYVKSDINKNNTNLLRQVKENVELVVGEMDTINLLFRSNGTAFQTLDSILSDSKFDLENVNLTDLLKGYILSPASARPYIHSLYIYADNPNNRFLSSMEGLTTLETSADSTWYKNMNEKATEYQTWIDIRQVKQYEFETPSKVISIFQRLNQKNGIIVLNISPEYIEKLINNLAVLPEQTILVVDEKGQIFFNNQNLDFVKNLDIASIVKEEASFFNYEAGRSSYIVTKLESKRYDWKYVSIIPQSVLYQIPIRLTLVTVLLLVLSFVLGLVLSLYLTKKNYQNISGIISIIDSAESGKPLPPLPDRVKNEYEYIVQNILKTFIEQSYLKVQLSEKKYKFRAMELLALQSQLNPHFLFNTLATISIENLSLIGRPNSVNHMINSLSDILKYSLSDPSSDVTFSEEINYTKRYIDIQKYRYEEKFDVIWEYDDDILHYRVIKMLLQPFIENSIYHGIAEKEGKSLIKINIRQKDTEIRIAITDNGCGMPVEMLRKLRQDFESEQSYSEHIGIINTYKRLKLLYGNQSIMKIRSKAGLGTSISITIPT